MKVKNGEKDKNLDKSHLLQSNTLYREALEEQITGIKVKAGSWIKGGAIIGGVILAGYSFFKIFMEEEEEDETVSESNQLTINPGHLKTESSLARMIKESITLFLISLAKQKIQEFIDGIENEEIVDE